MSTLEALQGLIHEKYGLAPSELDPHASMRDKGLDSLALVEFLFAIEDRFGISMPDPGPELDTLAQLAEVLDRVLAERAGSGAAAAAEKTA